MDKGCPRHPKGSHREPEGTSAGANGFQRTFPIYITLYIYIHICIYIYIQTPDQPPQRTLCYSRFIKKGPDLGP